MTSSEFEEAREYFTHEEDITLRNMEQRYYETMRDIRYYAERRYRNFSILGLEAIVYEVYETGQVIDEPEPVLTTEERLDLGIGRGLRGPSGNDIISIKEDSCLGEGLDDHEACFSCSQDATEVHPKQLRFDKYGLLAK